jgi:hypothetical protein
MPTDDPALSIDKATSKNKRTGSELDFPQFSTVGSQSPPMVLQSRRNKPLSGHGRDIQQIGRRQTQTRVRNCGPVMARSAQSRRTGRADRAVRENRKDSARRKRGGTSAVVTPGLLDPTKLRKVEMNSVIPANAGTQVA